MGRARLRERAYFRGRRLLGLRPGPRTTRGAANPETPSLLPSFRLCALTVAFAEEDVIGATVANAFIQGCDEVFLIDNESPDATVERAAAAGATILPGLEMAYHDEAVRVGALNEAMRRLSRERDDEHIWWLVVDADEFPCGPAGTTIREYLGHLDRRFRVVGSTHLNHYPTTTPAGVVGIHPLTFQPMAEREEYNYCELGHHKHPLIRYDRGQEPISIGLGLHRPAGEDETWLEPNQGIITHHFQFRDEAATRRRMALMRERLRKRRPLAARIECVDAVYAGDWNRVRLRRTRLGDRPVKLRPWTELVAPADAVVAGFDPDTTSAIADAWRPEPPADRAGDVRPWPGADRATDGGDVRVSILIEWDNAQRANFHRPVEMLRRLRHEVHSLGQPIEVLIGHRDSLDPVTMKNTVAESGVDSDPWFRVDIVNGGHRHYYELKNLLATMAHGELLVFLDSDVWPKPGWLSTVVAAYDDAEVQVVAGQAFVGPLDSTFARALAAAWFFPVEQPGGSLVPVRDFYANNVTFRRDTFLAHRYPEQPDRFRGQCNQLAAALRESGVTIWQARDACVMHPPPDGWRDFMQRAALKGSDFNLNWRLGDRRDYFGRAARHLSYSTAVSLRKVLRERGALGLSPYELGYAVVAVVLYWSAVAAAMVADRLRPGVVRRWL